MSDKVPHKVSSGISQKKSRGISQDKSNKQNERNTHCIGDCYSDLGALSRRSHLFPNLTHMRLNYLQKYGHTAKLM